MTPSAILNGPAWARAQHFRRQEYPIVFTGASRQVLPANPSRMGLIVSAPGLPANTVNQDTAQAAGVDTSTTGVKLTKNTSGSIQETLATATFQETAATGVVADLELVRASTTYKLARYTTSGLFSVSMPLGTFDTIQWNVITSVPASTSDFTITLLRSLSLGRVTLSVNNPAVDGSGICLYPNNMPLVLWRDVIGDALTEDLFGIASSSGLQIGVWDIFY